LKFCLIIFYFKLNYSNFSIGNICIAIHRYEGTPKRATTLILRKANYFKGAGIPHEAAMILASESYNLLPPSIGPDPYVLSFKIFLAHNISPRDSATMAAFASKQPGDITQRLLRHYQETKYALTSKRES
ncbi:MAG: hypothetical protein AABX11_00455, partial [Nanoarchaeota archaeon]